MGSEFRQIQSNHLILADPDPVYRRICKEAAACIQDTELNISEAGDADTLARLVNTDPDAALLIDPALFRETASSCVLNIKKLSHTGAIIICTRDAAANSAIAFIKDGADKVLVKPSQKAKITDAILDLARRRLNAPSKDQPLPTSFPGDFAGFVGQSETMRAIYAQIRSIAKSTAPAFITGESGTGKELCAEAIHQLSTRAHRPLISLNCSAIPQDLMESEIFGHVKGAFTGAVNDRPGAAELAHGGTLFLDEICEMHPALQAKLLRFIQTGIIRRVGGSADVKVDIRFVCATNRDPRAEVRAGNFREDLYYRLHVIPLQLSPLRERKEDILPIAQNYLHRCAQEENSSFEAFSADAVKLLQTYKWAGNVRQLQNVIRRLVVLNDGVIVDREMLLKILEQDDNAVSDAPTTVISYTPPPKNTQSEKQILPLMVQEKRIIEDAVMHCKGNIVEAARALAISPSTIYRKL
ncbi:MAG: sigma-54 dependent transcriptional regulator, partial [Fimbriimonadaceae bacterium]|nr:sigma-54 dependent transcriptional regulator [Alphaproteobacteria bacterium]